ncbi:MAG TPA: peptidoglycan DD-metalloendopeptidase family protein [Acetobacteraceae bacterium]|nr:peptidoglycan DD-metalloendopeptidase family protein [Acetobacteraceae bacterium]
MGGSMVARRHDGTRPARLLVLGLGLLCALPAAFPASAQELPPSSDAARRQLQRAEQNRAAQLAQQRAAAMRAQQAAAESDRLAASRAEAAAKLRTTEEAIADLASRMDGLARARAAVAARLRARQADLQPMLPLIERLSLYPAETLLAAPAPPQQAVTGLLVIKGLTERLRQEMLALRQDAAEQARLDAELRDETARLAAARAAQAAAGAALDQQIATAEQSRQAAEAAASTAARRAQAEAARAATLRGLIANLDAARQAAEEQAREEAAQAEQRRREAEAEAANARAEQLAPPPGPGPSATGTLVSPVAGGVVREWGAATEAGPANGVTYGPPPAARVVSPCGGRVVFAAPFRSFGRLVIVDCGGGYHFVLAGLERLDVDVGQAVHAGEPVGAMPDWDPGRAGDRPALYVELRRGGQPVNPEPFLRAKGGAG